MTFSIIKQPNKNKIFVVRLDEYNSFILTLVYNSISDTYMGTTIDCFIETIRSIERTVPGFFEIFEGYSPEESLNKMGFVLTPATQTELLLYTDR
jgi:hypothetical protein